MGKSGQINSQATKQVSITISKLEEIFLSKVEKTDYCWNWIGTIDQGYGIFSFDGIKFRAHRFSYDLYNGYVPDELMVCHKCDNPRCVNPEHLFLGTAKDNIQDMISKGRDNFKTNAVLTEEQIRQIRKLYKPEYGVQSRLAEFYEVSPDAIFKIINYDTWPNVIGDPEFLPDFTFSNSLYDRLLRKVNKTETCWLWTGTLSSAGYGRIRIADKLIMAHKLMYEITYGEIPYNAVLRHSCNNRTCVKPVHLILEYWSR